MATSKPDALLLVSTGCSHCGRMLSTLSELLEQGELGRLEVYNIAVNNGPPEARGIRSVPWLRLGELEFGTALADLKKASLSFQKSGQLHIKR